MLAVVNGEILELEETGSGWCVHLVQRGQTFNCQTLSEVLVRIFTVRGQNYEMARMVQEQ